MSKVLTIQYLRAVAALAVVFFHAMDRLGLGRYGSIGAAGVDVFFVISGFVMWSIASAKESSPKEFMRNRVTRIVPVYWLYTLAIVAAATIHPAIFPRLQLSLEHIVSSLLFIPHYPPEGGEIRPIIAVGWSLEYEMFFYTVFAGFLFLSASWRFAGLLATLAIAVALGLFYSGQDPLLLTYGDPILLEFGAGVVIARLIQLGRIPGRKSGLLLAAAGILGFAASALFETSPSYQVIFWGIPAFALVAGLVIFEHRGGVGSYKLLERLGDASYSIYLVHTILIALLASVIGSRLSHSFPAAFVAISLVAAALAGLCSYYLIERPLNRAFRRSAGDYKAAAAVKLEPALQQL